ncbi:chemotaxis protein CheW [Pseudomonas sp. NyZ704]|nr:chemotaxis protein CheW [Pseudomonas sp. NyZ704]
MTKPLPVQQFSPQQTIQSYLDALLQDAIEDLSLAEELEAPTFAAPVEYAEPPTAEISRAVLETTTVEVAVVSVDAVELPVEVESAPPLVEQPQWREQPFEALLFNVGGLTLAVPLILLGTIHPLESEITPLFGQPDWFLGIMPTSAGNLKVLDTARWVMPERYVPELQNDLRFVISVQGYDWGLAVHDVSKSVKLTPEQVKWRSQEGKRPWLAGTVIEHMCALVDVSALAGLIAAGAKTQQGAKVERALA